MDRDEDAKLFVDRETELRLLDGFSRRHVHTLVYGPPGSGITSLLRQHQRQLRLKDHACIWVPVNDLDQHIPAKPRPLNPPPDPYSPGPLHRLGTSGLQNWYNSIDPPESERRARDIFDRDREENYRRGRSIALAIWLERITEQLTGEHHDAETAETALADLHNAASRLTAPLVAIVDAPPPHLANLLFGTWRDSLWDIENLIWVVGTDSSHRSTITRGPASEFFEQIELSPLDRTVAADLLRARGLELSDDQIDQAMSASDRTPRGLLNAARPFTLNDDYDQYLRWRNNLVQQVGRKAAMTLIEMGDRAWSASDPELQDRLGISRGRLTELFNELLEAGAVITHEVPTGGRPRKEFQAVTHDNWQKDPR